MAKRIRLLFYVPSRIYGGTELLFLRLIDYLAKLNEYDIDVIASKESVFYQKLPAQVNVLEKIELNYIYDGMIISAKYICEFCMLFNTVVVRKVYIWQLQPDELATQFFPYVNRFRIFGALFSVLRSIQVVFLFHSRKKMLCKKLDEWENNDGLLYMDKSNYCETQAWLNRDIHHEVEYQPIASPARDYVYSERCTDIISDVLIVSIVSRISFDFKYYPILSTIEALYIFSIKNKRRIKLYVVGDGDALDFLKKEVSQFICDDLAIIFCGFMPIDVVVRDIYPNVDVAIGMGTSVLDSASLGIPTLVTDLHTFRINGSDARFRWLHQVDGFNVGNYIQKKSTNGFDLNTGLEYFYSNRILLSERDYSYFMNNHEVNKNFNLLMSRIKRKKGVPNLFDDISLIKSKSRMIDVIYDIIFSYLRFLLKKK